MLSIRRAAEEAEVVEAARGEWTLPKGLPFEDRPFDLASLEAAAGITNARLLAKALGLKWRETVYRWRARGLSVWEADTLACRLGMHPSAVWGDLWWSAGDTALWCRKCGEPDATGSLWCGHCGEVPEVLEEDGRQVGDEELVDMAAAEEPLHVDRTTRLPMGSLEAAVGASSTSWLAVRLVTTPGQVARWRRVGLSVKQARKLAARAGLHPSEIWPEWAI